jgi:hypothetical protein
MNKYSTPSNWWSNRGAQHEGEMARPAASLWD